MHEASVKPLPVEVSRLLAGLRWRARAWVAVEAVSVLLLAGAAACWGAYAIDRLVEPPAWVRAAALAVAVAAAGWILAARLVARLRVPLSDGALSLAVERTHPAVGEALSTVVSCATARGPEGGAVDPELVARTAAAARHAVGMVEPGRVFRVRRLTLVAAVAAAAVTGTAAAAVVRPDLARVWLRRLVLLSDDVWPRRVRIAAEAFPNGRRVVARGADADVLVRVAAAGPLPEVVELRSRGRSGWRTDRMGTRGAAVDGEQFFGHVLTGLSEDLEVEIRAGDARLRGLRVAVAEPPAIESVAITCTPPAYLGEPPAPRPASRVVSVPRGSRVEIAATSTKPYAAVAASARTPGAAVRELPVTPAGPPDAARRGLRLVIDDVDADTEVLLRLTDDDGLVSRDDVPLILDAEPDEPPRLALRLAGISTAVTPTARVPVTGTITDDHGIAAAAVRLRVGETGHDLPIERASAAGVELVLPPERPEVVPLADLGLVPGMRLGVTVIASDGCGLAAGPNRSEGDTWTLDVVAPDALKALLEVREVTLRRRFEGAVADLAKARDAAATGDTDPARSLAAAVARAAGETGEVATAFRDIRGELEINGLLTPEIDGRLVGEIAAPLERVAARELAAAAQGCRAAADRPTLVRLVDAALAGMRGVIERMRDLESVNEVIERLRGVIDAQRAIHEDTIEQRRKRGREALESP